MIPMLTRINKVLLAIVQAFEFKSHTHASDADTEDSPSIERSQGSVG